MRAEPLSWRGDTSHRQLARSPGRACGQRPPQGMAVRMTTDGGIGQTRSAGGVATSIKDLHPSYLAFVMATGIISTGAFLLGPSWLSLTLLVIASIGFVVLVVELPISIDRYPSRLLERQ